MKPLPPLPQKSLKVGVVQMTSGEDVEANVQMALLALDRLRNENCDLICLPENALYLRIQKKPKDRVGFHLREEFWKLFQSFSKNEKCSILFGSVPYRSSVSQKKFKNATVLVELGKKPKVVYEKIHLFDVEVDGAPPVRESDDYGPGRKPQILKIKGWNVALSICYDMRFAELYGHYAEKNAHLILVPAAFLVPTGKAHWHVLLRARAIESQAYVVAAAQCGGHQHRSGALRETYGHSLVVGPWGDVLIDLGREGATVGVVELDPAALQKVRWQIPMAHHRYL